jgi:hypothetical protein
MTSTLQATFEGIRIEYASVSRLMEPAAHHGSGTGASFGLNMAALRRCGDGNHRVINRVFVQVGQRAGLSRVDTLISRGRNRASHDSYIHQHDVILLHTKT